MKLNITPSAHQWFKHEVGVSTEQGVHFYGKVYGNTAIHDGFSVGLSIEAPTQTILVEVNMEGIRYFIEEMDEWFFKGYDLLVDFDAKKDEPRYQFIPNHETEEG